MKAVVVTPGQAGSGRLEDVHEPVRTQGDVLLETIEVGVCGTDAEILRGDYGTAPPHEETLILGHENLARVVDAPAGSGFATGDLAVCIVRRPDPIPCRNCAHGEWDMCLNGLYRERGIKELPGFMSERFAEVPDYLVKLDPSVEPFGVLLEPLTVVEKAYEQTVAIQRRMTWEPNHAIVVGAGPIGLMATLLCRLHGLEVDTFDLEPRDSIKARAVEECGGRYRKSDEEPLEEVARQMGHIDLIVEATGIPQLVFESMRVVGTNGVVALTGLSGSSRKLSVGGDLVSMEMVLENKVVFGSVNANRHMYELGAEHLAELERKWPGLPARMVTRREPPERFAEALEKRPGKDLKVAVRFAGA